MPPDHDPMRYFGRKIQAAVTHDPAFDAMFTRHRQIPNTWGNLASQLVEEGLVEPTPEAAMDLLGIERDQLGDTSLMFTEPYEVEAFERQFTDRHAEAYKQQRVPAARAFVVYLDEIFKPWEVEPDEIEIEALEIQINDLWDKKDQTQEEYETKKAELGKLSLRRAALDTGLAIPLAEFVQAVVSYEPEDGFTKTERTSAVKDVLHDIASSITFTERVQVDEVLVGRRMVNSYVSSLYHRLTRRGYLHANREWDRIEHLFIASRPQDHPFFAGTEK